MAPPAGCCPHCGVDLAEHGRELSLPLAPVDPARPVLAPIPREEMVRAFACDGCGLVVVPKAPEERDASVPF